VGEPRRSSRSIGSRRNDAGAVTERSPGPAGFWLVAAAPPARSPRLRDQG
jgi:hypothetical protein